MLPAPAAGQLPPGGGSLYLFSDSSFTDSSYVDQAPGKVSVYVVHRGVTYGHVRIVWFMVEASPGITFEWLGESSPMATLVVGDSQTGIAMDYGACLFPDPGLILVIHYWGFGTSDPCSSLRVVAPPGTPTGEITVGLCVGQGPISAVGKRLLVNSSVPVETSTWGRVKSLYTTR